MKEFKASTKQGQRIISMSESCTGTTLRDIYSSWSADKEAHYERCKKLCADSDGIAFGVKACGSWSFVASWCCIINGENVMRVETRDNSYLVWLDR